MNDDFDQLDATAAQLRLEFAAMVNMPRMSVTRTGKWVEGVVLPYLGLRFVLARKQYVRMILMPVILQTAFASVRWADERWGGGRSHSACGKTIEARYI